MESCVDVGDTEPPISNMDAMGNADSLPEHFVDENANTQRATADASPQQPNDELFGQVKYLGMSSTGSHVEVTEHMHEVIMRDAVSLPAEKSVDEDTSLPNTNAGQTTNLSGKQEDNGSVVSLYCFDKSNPSVLEEAKDGRQIDPEQLPEVQVVNSLGGKRETGKKRIRSNHPMTKSLAEAGTTIENGVRRSTRIRMRPLEYWKGERFVYGRVDGSLKLLGVKYFSPGESNEDLKVKPFIQLEKPELKEILDQEARL